MSSPTHPTTDNGPIPLIWEGNPAKEDAVEHSKEAHASTVKSRVEEEAVLENRKIASVVDEIEASLDKEIADLRALEDAEKKNEYAAGARDDKNVDAGVEQNDTADEESPGEDNYLQPQEHLHADGDDTVLVEGAEQGFRTPPTPDNEGHVTPDSEEDELITAHSPVMTLPMSMLMRQMMQPSRGSLVPSSSMEGANYNRGNGAGPVGTSGAGGAAQVMCRSRGGQADEAGGAEDGGEGRDTSVARRVHSTEENIARQAGGGASPEDDVNDDLQTGGCSEDPEENCGEDDEDPSFEDLAELARLFGGEAQFQAFIRDCARRVQRMEIRKHLGSDYSTLERIVEERDEDLVSSDEAPCGEKSSVDETSCSPLLKTVVGSPHEQVELEGRHLQSDAEEQEEQSGENEDITADLLQGKNMLEVPAPEDNDVVEQGTDEVDIAAAMLQPAAEPLLATAEQEQQETANAEVEPVPAPVEDALLSSSSSTADAQPVEPVVEAVVEQVDPEAQVGEVEAAAVETQEDVEAAEVNTVEKHALETPEAVNATPDLQTEELQVAAITTTVVPVVCSEETEAEQEEGPQTESDNKMNQDLQEEADQEEANQDTDAFSVYSRSKDTLDGREKDVRSGPPEANPDVPEPDEVSAMFEPLLENAVEKGVEADRAASRTSTKENAGAQLAGEGGNDVNLKQEEDQGSKPKIQFDANVVVEKAEQVVPAAQSTQNLEAPTEVSGGNQATIIQSAPAIMRCVDDVDEMREDAEKAKNSRALSPRNQTIPVRPDSSSSYGEVRSLASRESMNALADATIGEAASNGLHNYTVGVVGPVKEVERFGTPPDLHSSAHVTAFGSHERMTPRMIEAGKTNSEDNVRMQDSEGKEIEISMQAVDYAPPVTAEGLLREGGTPYTREERRKWTAEQKMARRTERRRRRAVIGEYATIVNDDGTETQAPVDFAELGLESSSEDESSSDENDDEETKTARADRRAQRGARRAARIERMRVKTSHLNLPEDNADDMKAKMKSFLDSKIKDGEDDNKEEDKNADDADVVEGQGEESKAEPKEDAEKNFNSKEEGVDSLKVEQTDSQKAAAATKAVAMKAFSKAGAGRLFGKSKAKAGPKVKLSPAAARAAALAAAAGEQDKAKKAANANKSKESTDASPAPSQAEKRPDSAEKEKKSKKKKKKRSRSSSDSSESESTDPEERERKNERRRQRLEARGIKLDENRITTLVTQVARRVVLDEVIIESKNEKQLLNILRMRDEEIRKALAMKSETEGTVSMMEKTLETYRAQCDFLQKERDNLMQKLAEERVISQHAQVFVDNQSNKAEGLEEILKEERKIFSKDLRRLQAEVETSKESHRVEVLAYRKALSVEEAKVASLMHEVREMKQRLPEDYGNTGESGFLDHPSVRAANAKKLAKKKQNIDEFKARQKQQIRQLASSLRGEDKKVGSPQVKRKTADAIATAYGQKFPANRVLLPKLV
ncbi:unnamed protein product [Amoebophrya sp. A25]|nr:unnamed protein product [Amoebophrya sp. A25]|eukprot:GSA25T00023158001.1